MSSRPNGGRTPGSIALRRRREPLAGQAMAAIVIAAAWSAAASYTAPVAAESVELSAIDGTLGVTVHGAASPDFTGASLGGAGDVNCDGIDDFVIGASGAGPSGFGSGAYVVFGKPGGLPPIVETFALDGTDGFALNGAAAGDFAGVSVAAAGDVNGDGRDDVIVGAWAADPNGSSSGASYVVYGRDTPFPPAIALSALDGTDGFVINGVTSPDRSGISVATAGDVNDDGWDDVIIGALNSAAHGPSTGTAYVVFGRPKGFPAAIELSSLDGTNGFAMNGVAAGDNTGVSVGGAGDVDADGITDIVIGATSASNGGIHSGAAYIVFGSATTFPALIELADLDGVVGFTCTGAVDQDSAGVSVAAAGDVNDDGIADLVIGASRADPGGADSGAVYVVFGAALPFPAVLSLASLDGTNGFAIAGAAPGDRAGVSAASAGDFDGDGVDDLVIGAEDATPNGFESGAAYVVFGRSEGFPAAVSLSAIDATEGFALNGPLPGDLAGSSVASGGDLNGDGTADVLVGAPGADPHGAVSGAAWVVYGDDADCNRNGVLDFLDLVGGGSVDDDGNGIPDECETGCVGDLDGNLEVDFTDLLALLDAWGPCAACDEDLDADGEVDFADLLLLLFSWGAC